MIFNNFGPILARASESSFASCIFALFLFFSAKKRLRIEIYIYRTATTTRSLSREWMNIRRRKLEIRTFFFSSKFQTNNRSACRVLLTFFISCFFFFLFCYTLHYIHAGDLHSQSRRPFCMHGNISEYLYAHKYYMLTMMPQNFFNLCTRSIDFFPLLFCSRLHHHHRSELRNVCVRYVAGSSVHTRRRLRRVCRAREPHLHDTEKMGIVIALLARSDFRIDPRAEEVEWEDRRREFNLNLRGIDIFSEWPQRVLDSSPAEGNITSLKRLFLPITQPTLLREVLLFIDQKNIVD